MPNCDDMSEKADAWERVHSNYAEIWDNEPDPDRLRQAYAIAEAEPENAFQMYRNLADNGSITSMITVAWYYAWGNGKVIPPDDDQAYYWYKRAWAAGSWLATRDYARFVANRGNFAECEDVLKMGVEKDWTPAFYWLAHYRLKQSNSLKAHREVKPLLETAAERGHPWAQLLLARSMMRGKFGVREIPRGMKLMREQVANCVAELNARDKSDHAVLAETETKAV